MDVKLGVISRELDDMLSRFKTVREHDGCRMNDALLHPLSAPGMA